MIKHLRDSRCIAPPLEKLGTRRAFIDRGETVRFAEHIVSVEDRNIDTFAGAESNGRRTAIPVRRIVHARDLCLMARCISAGHQ
jgi:hypothetical protein